MRKSREEEGGEMRLREKEMLRGVRENRRRAKTLAQCDHDKLLTREEY